MTARVLVTGGLGYVGSRLTPYLLRQGHTVRVLDLCLYGHDGLRSLEAQDDFGSFQTRFSLIQGDIRDPVAVREALTGMDVVIHLAAISNDPTGQVDETLTRQVNFDAVGMLLAVAREQGVKRFINASSSSVFGIKTESNVTEDLEPEPLTYYSKYKALGEWLVRAAATPDFVTVSIRPATICGYSPRQRFDLTVNKLTADAVRTGLITVHGGQQRRPNVTMTDMVRFYAELLEYPSDLICGKTFNFGFENLKVIEIAETIKEELSDLPVEIKIAPVQDQRDYHISSVRVMKELGFTPQKSIRDEIREIRRALESKAEFHDIEDPKYYNMRSMRLERRSDHCRFLIG